MLHTKIAHFGPFIFIHLECDLHQKFNYFQNSMLEVSAINFADIHPILSETFFLRNLITETDRRNRVHNQPEGWRATDSYGFNMKIANKQLGNRKFRAVSDISAWPWCVYCIAYIQGC